MGSKTISRVAEDAVGFRYVCPYLREDGGPEFEYTIHKRYRSVVGDRMLVCFVWLE